MREHWQFCVVLALALLLRVAATVAYRPILFFPDSWDYVFMASSGSPVSFSTSGHPSGYPLFLEVASEGLDSLVAVAVAQHLAGLVTGTLAYVLLLRCGLRKLVAAGVAALLLLDSAAIALEQHLATEALFTMLLTAAAFLVVVPARPVALRWVALGGLLLAAAVTVRTGAFFALPFWLAYLVIAHRSPRAVAVGLATIAVPLVAYSLAHGAVTGWYGPTESDGWLLYGRVARLADCANADVPAATRPLCGTERLEDPIAYIWTDRSPARRLFGPLWEGSVDSRKWENEQLRAFAIAVFRDHPWLYTKMIAEDVFRIVRPGSRIRPPAAFPRRLWNPVVVAALRKDFFPSYAVPGHPPAEALLSYQRWGHVPRWLVGVLGLFGIGVLLAAGLSVISRRRTPMPRMAAEVLLLTGMGVVVFVGSVATSTGNSRYLATQVPLIVCGGIIALAAVLPRLRARGRMRTR